MNNVVTISFSIFLHIGAETWDLKLCLQAVDTLYQSTYKMRIHSLGLSNSRYVQLSIVEMMRSSYAFQRCIRIMCRIRIYNSLGEDSIYGHVCSTKEHLLSPNAKDHVADCKQLLKVKL